MMLSFPAMPDQILDWERLWAAYDEPTYQAVLAYARPDDVVLEIGAGDLRLAFRLAERARAVYAIEIQARLVRPALTRRARLQAIPDNLHILCGDARRMAFPPGISLGVLLMRHCRCFGLYAAKLAQAGCSRLVTNARWGLDVELVDLSLLRLPFDQVTMGWYACWCGAVGFVPGPPEDLTPAVEATIHQVSQCPCCTSSNRNQPVTAPRPAAVYPH